MLQLAGRCGSPRGFCYQLVESHLFSTVMTVTVAFFISVSTKRNKGWPENFRTSSEEQKGVEQDHQQKEHVLRCVLLPPRRALHPLLLCALGRRVPEEVQGLR